MERFQCCRRWGSQAMTALKARISSGNPPTAVQMLGFTINEWAEIGIPSQFK